MDSVKRIFLYFLLVGLLITAVSCQADDAETDNSADTETVETNSDTTEEAPAETSNDTAESNADTQTIITFAVNEWERGRYKDQIEIFEETHPDIKVELISGEELMESPEGDDGYFDPFQDGALLSLVQGADVISWYIQPGLVQDGLLLNLDPLIAADDSFDVSDFYLGTIDRYQWDGGTWGVPLNANFLLIFYDKDLFDAAGVDYPEQGWTWDDFLATAQAVTMRDGDEVTQWGFTNQYTGDLGLVQAKIGPIIDATSEPATARFEDPDVVAAFQWVADLYTEYEVIPYAATSEEDFSAYEEIYNMLEEGKIAMWADSVESFAWRSQNRNLGVVPFPVSDDNPNSSPTVSWGSGILAVSAGTAYPDAAWEWISFLTEQDGDEMVFFGVDGPTSVPARRSVAERSGLWDEMDEALSAAARFAVEHAFVTENSLVGGEAIYGILPAIIEEDRDVADALADAQEAFETGVEELANETEEEEPVPEFTVAEPPSSQIEEGDTIVRFVVSGADTSAYRKVADRFHELHPDIVVQVEEPNFYSGSFTVETLIGDADAFQWWNSLTTDHDLAGVLPIQPLLTADPDLAEEDFFPAALDEFRVQGQVVGLPGHVQMPLLNYNKRLFDAAGLDYPQPGWTMQEFLETAVALTEDGSEDEKVYGYMADTYEFGEALLFLALQDVVLVDESVDPVTTNFTDPNTISALRWFTNLTTEYGVKPVFDTSGFNPYEERNALIDNDRAGIWRVDRYGVTFFEDGEEVEEDTSHIGVVTYPVGDGGKSTYETVGGYYISADTEVRQAAWEWLKFLTTQESLAQGGLPARISTAESDAYVQRVGETEASVLSGAVLNSNGSLYSDMYSEDVWIVQAISTGLNEAYQNILDGEMTVEEALQNAQDKAEVYRQCIIERELVDTVDYEEFQPCLDEADLSWGF